MHPGFDFGYDASWLRFRHHSRRSALRWSYGGGVLTFYCPKYKHFHIKGITQRMEKSCFSCIVFFTFSMLQTWSSFLGPMSPDYPHHPYHSYHPDHPELKECSIMRCQSSIAMFSCLLRHKNSFYLTVMIYSFGFTVWSEQKMVLFSFGDKLQEEYVKVTIQKNALLKISFDILDVQRVTQARFPPWFFFSFCTARFKICMLI